MLFIMEGMLYNPISQEMHAFTLVLNLIEASLSLFHSFPPTFLSWLGKWDLLCEMRPKCGPFHQFGPHADQVRNCGLLWMQCTTETNWWTFSNMIHFQEQNPRTSNSTFTGLEQEVLHQITSTEMMATTSQVAEEAGKQGFWDKLRNTFVRE